MFWHNFKYTLKILFKNRMLIFWTFAFPLILGLFFNMAFSSIEESETFSAIDIAVVNDENFKNNEVFKKVLEELSSEQNENKIFNIQYVGLEEAEELLADDDIVGYLSFENNLPKITISTSGSYETIFKNIIDEITQTIFVTNNVMESLALNNNIDYQKIYQESSNIIENASSNIQDISSNHLSYVMIEFYTLIAMACLYGGVISMEAMNQSLPNMDHKGKRIFISSIPKKTTILSNLLASYIIQLLGMFLLFAFLLFVLHIDFGNHLLLCILLSVVASLAGLAIGLLISVAFKTNENTKVGIIIAISMVGSFLSGMMGITMKYIVDTNIPLLNKINPANMITDGFYSLYYYDTFNRYSFDLISLLIFSIILIVISVVILRRQKYDSI